MKIRKFISLCLIIILTLSVFSVNTTILAQRNTRHKYVVVTRNHNHTKEHIGKDNIHKEHIYKDTSDVIVADMSEYEAEQLEATDEVVAVVEDISLYAHSEESEEQQEQQELWNVQMINAEELTQNEQTVSVGVMDSGINFGDNISVAGNVDFVEEETPFLFPDYSGHGTAVASVISSKNFGVKPNSSMYSIKVIDSSNEALLSNVLSGIYWAIENDIKILNMSFGTATYSPALEQAINDAYNAGILIIASAGNGTDKMYPAGFENVIAVGSLNHKGEVVSENSQHYTNNLLFAPGERVATEGDFGFVQESSGTSFACPHVTAIAAQILEKDQTKTNDFVKSLLFASANTSSGVKVIDTQYALQNYDEFESTYQQTATTPPTLSNTTDLTTFTDVEFEALWGGARHEETVTNALSTDDLTQKQIDIVKIFSVIPDLNADHITFARLYDGVPESKDDYKNRTGISVSINGQTYNFANYIRNRTNLYYADTDSNHYINSATAGDNIHFMKDYILHGRYNYVLSIRYLYDVAKYLWYEDDYKTETYRKAIINNAITSVYSGNASNLYGDTTKYSFKELNIDATSGTVSITQKQRKFYYDNDSYNNIEQRNLRNTLDEMIYLAANCEFVGDSFGYRLGFSTNNDNYPHINFQKEAALKVLGIAIHLLGDTYAHRTIIQENVNFINGVQPTSIPAYTIYSGLEKDSDGNITNRYDFSRNGYWSGAHGIKTLINDGAKRMLMNTHQIKEWQKAGVGGLTGCYEDYIAFLPERYEFAKRSVVKLVNLFINNEDFDADVFRVDNNASVQSNQRLADLRQFVFLSNSIPSTYTVGSTAYKNYLRYYDSATSTSDIAVSDTELTGGINYLKRYSKGEYILSRNIE